jgi:hypothetical protein
MATYHNVRHLQDVYREFDSSRRGIGFTHDSGRRDNIPDILYHKQVARLALRNQLGKHAGIGAGDE